jgi:hypothetical protein
VGLDGGRSGHLRSSTVGNCSGELQHDRSQGRDEHLRGFGMLDVERADALERVALDVGLLSSKQRKQRRQVFRRWVHSYGRG